LQNAVGADPTETATRLDLAQFLLGQGKPEQAQPIIDELLEQQPDNTEALAGKFKVSAARKDLAAAKAAADAIVAANPKLETGYYYQGVAAEMDRRFSDAVRYYSAALQVQADNHEALQALTRVLIHENRLPDALQALDSTAAGYPRDAFAPGLKGEILMSQKRAAEAVLEFKIAIERAPKNWQPYRNLALAQDNEQDSRAAVATLQSGIEKVDAPEPLEAALASLYERSDKPEAAIQVYDSGLRRNPKSELLANNLAMLLANTQKDAASLDRAKQLSAPLSGLNDPRFLDTYGWVLYKRGEAPAAVTVLQRASSQAPEAPQIWFHLGMAQASAGQSDAARSSLARALKTGRKFPGSEEANQTLNNLTKQASIEVAPKS
jgi:tetratricopeptide (TPR) repeat protein